MAAQNIKYTDAVRWSNRILFIALAGIFFLTFYPFRFSFTMPPGVANPFLLGSSGKGGLRDDLLNILLFMPFGFGISQKYFEKRRSWASSAITSYISGFFLSYFIEFVQLYIPSRDSGWRDTITNSAGAAAGCLLFKLCGPALVKVATHAENGTAALFSGRRSYFTVPAYFGFWIAVSVGLQMQAGLSNWDPQGLLIVGGDPREGSAACWKGQLYRLEFWSRALQAKSAREIGRAPSAPPDVPAPVASYDFAQPPYRDSKGNLPDLMPAAGSAQVDAHKLVLNGSALLLSTAPLTALIDEVKHNNQFAMRVVCQPSQIEGVDARIVSIASRSGLVNMQIRQEGDELVFRFRSPLSVRHAYLAWRIPEIFTADLTRDIIFSYDGAHLSVYVDGQEIPPAYQLGPGAGLARMIRSIKPREMAGYEQIYYALVFFPGGVLCGLALRANPSTLSKFVWPLGIALAAGLALEAALVMLSGRSFALQDILFALLFSLAGSLWSVSDGTLSRTVTKS